VLVWTATWKVADVFRYVSKRRGELRKSAVYQPPISRELGSRCRLPSPDSRTLLPCGLILSIIWPFFERGCAER